jgi:DNA-binding SARP family transcriptional activator
MSEWSLLLLGSPEAVRDGEVVPLRLRKVVALLAYLGVEKRSFSREYLATLLWPEYDRRSALADLRRTLSAIRRDLGSDLLRGNGDQVQLNPDAVSVDIDIFHDVACPAPPDGNLARLEEAVALYQGHFLEGFGLGDCEEFDRWQDVIRQNLRWELDAVLETLCRSYLHLRSYESALRYARRWLELDPLNEGAHRVIMEVFARTGRRGAAQEAYEACQAALGEEGLEPEEETRELYEAIVRGSLSRRRLPRQSVAPPGPPVRSGARWPRLAWLLAGPRRWLLVPILLAVAAGVTLPLVLTHPARDLVVTDFGLDPQHDYVVGFQLAISADGRIDADVDYAVLFSSDPHVSLKDDLVV